MRYNDIYDCCFSNRHCNNRDSANNSSEGDTDDGVDDWVIL